MYRGLNRCADRQMETNCNLFTEIDRRKYTTTVCLNLLWVMKKLKDLDTVFNHEHNDERMGCRLLGNSLPFPAVVLE